MLEKISTASAETQAITAINAVIDDQKDKRMTARSFVSTVEDSVEQAGPEAEAAARELLDAYRGLSHDTIIATLEDGVGGAYDGGITISTATLEIGREGVSETAKMIKEVKDHEEYHRKNDHLSPIIAGKSAETRKGIIAVIGGIEFTDTSIHEADTVFHTGNTYVSTQYKKWEKDYLTAAARSGHSVEKISDALNRRDLRTVDDMHRPDDAFETAV